MHGEHLALSAFFPSNDPLCPRTGIVETGRVRLRMMSSMMIESVISSFIHVLYTYASNIPKIDHVFR